MEPERRIEKWLRAFAKKRREQAGEPMQLRPVARERLQREIARQSEVKSRGGFLAQLFSGLRPRLAFAICFVILLLGTLAFWPPLTHPKPTSLSMNKTSPPELLPGAAAPETAPTPVLSAPPASAPVAGADKKVLDEKRELNPVAPPPAQPTVAAVNRARTPVTRDLPGERDYAQNSEAQNQIVVTATATPAPPTNPYFASKNETAANSTGVAGTLAKDSQGTMTPAPVPQSNHLATGAYALRAGQQTSQAKLALQTPTAPAPTSTALFDSAKATGDATRTASQAFKRLETSAALRSATTVSGSPAPVLTSFRVEQNGNDMKVFDADGSVYTGSVQIAQQEPPAATRALAPKNQPAAQFTKTAAPAPPTYFFRVAGTNRQLNENIVFSGDFVPLTNSQSTTNSQPAAGARGFGGVAHVNVGGGGGGGIIEPKPGQPVQAILSNSQINGNVVVGDQKAIKVIATPAR